MENMYIMIIYLVFGITACFGKIQNSVLNDDVQKYKGDYFGQKPPTSVPEIFLPEVFNQFGYVHGKLTFSPNLKEVFWVITTIDRGKSIEKRLIIKQDENGVWGEPEESFMNTEFKENSPSFFHDGERIYYQSRSSLSVNGKLKDIDIFYREKEGNGWSEPMRLDAPVNSGKDDSQPWIAKDGSILFCRENDKSDLGYKGGSDIYYSEYKNGKYSEPQCLGLEINSPYHETEACISPDGSYLLFISNRPNGYSRMMNLYVSFRIPEGGWTQVECLSNKLKIDNIWFPTITYDGKYLFFCGGYPDSEGWGYSKSHYYWVSTDLIRQMNPNRGKN